LRHLLQCVSTFWVYYSPASKKHISDERIKARKLKKTRWWLDQINLGLCLYCQKTFNAEELTMDHKVPVARGGKSVKSNVVVACKTCNTNKKAKTPVELVLEKK